MKDDRMVTYTVTVDKDMFPFAPASEVVVRNLGGEWEKGIFQLREGEHHRVSLVDDYGFFTECHPLATHGHLLGTTYPADTPACSKCGKAAPRNCAGRAMFLLKEYEVCESCFAYGTAFKSTTATADGVTVKEQIETITAERDKLLEEVYYYRDGVNALMEERNRLRAELNSIKVKRIKLLYDESVVMRDGTKLSGPGNFTIIRNVKTCSHGGDSHMF